MDNCYVVVQCCGDYSEQSETPIKVFLDKEKAEQFVSKCNYVQDIVSKVRESVLKKRSVFLEKTPRLNSEDWHIQCKKAFQAINNDCLQAYKDDDLFADIERHINECNYDSYFHISDCEIE